MGIIDNLDNALRTWNEKLAEIWSLLMTSPQSFRGGGIWDVIVSINGALQAIVYTLRIGESSCYAGYDAHNPSPNNCTN